MTYKTETHLIVFFIRLFLFVLYPLTYRNYLEIKGSGRHKKFLKKRGETSW